VLEPKAVGCSILRGPRVDGDNHKRVLVRLASLDIEGVYQPLIHHGCSCNEMVAVSNRVLGAVPEPTEFGFSLMRQGANDIAHTLPITVADDLYDLPNRHTGAKSRKYREAADDLLSFGLYKKDAYVKAFVKPERFDPAAKVNPDPRVIQYRGAKYCVALAQYLRPIEEHIYQSTFASDGVPPSRNVAKGLDSRSRAELLMAKASHFDAPRFITCDASRFDKHVSVKHLQLEGFVYLTSNPDKEFRRLLAQQLRNVCFTSSGIKYTALGRRMSGDMNTGIGNIVIMLTMVIAICRHAAGLKRWDVLDDGDDFVLIVEECDVTHLLSKFGLWLEFGMEMKVDAVVADASKVVFCQSSVVEFRPNCYKFVRDYRAVISKSLCGVRNWGSVAYRRRVVKAIGCCELAINLGVPILQAFASALIRSSGDKFDPRYVPDGLLSRAKRDTRFAGVSLSSLIPQEITATARLSFESAFGVTPDEQVRIETALNRWVVKFTTLAGFPCDVDPNGWVATPTVNELVSLWKNDQSF